MADPINPSQPPDQPATSWEVSSRVLFEDIDQIPHTTISGRSIDDDEGTFLHERRDRREIPHVRFERAAGGSRNTAGVKCGQPVCIATVAHEGLQSQQTGCARLVFHDDRLPVEQSHCFKIARDRSGIQVYRAAW